MQCPDIVVADIDRSIFKAKQLTSFGEVNVLSFIFFCFYRQILRIT